MILRKKWFLMSKNYQEIKFEKEYDSKEFAEEQLKELININPNANYFLQKVTVYE